MLRILGNPRTACDGLTRRDFLRAGGIGLGGLGLNDLMRAQGTAALGGSSVGLPGFGRAKSVIVLFLFGAPSQMDTFDPKPEAPVEARGEFGTIPTSVPGLRICEHLPKIASQMHRVTLIRSMSHPYPTHATCYTLTGTPFSNGETEANNRHPLQWPYFGSTLDYVWSRNPSGRDRSGVPRSMFLPYALNSQTNNKQHGGMDAAWLGAEWNPVLPEFVGKATRAKGAPSADGAKAIFSHFDPYDGITPESTFRFPGAVPPAEVTLDRFQARRSLLEQLEGSRRQLRESAVTYDRFQRAAFDVVTSKGVVEALDVTREDSRVRESYGHTLFGQGALTCRRLIEAGVRVTLLFWDEYGPTNTAWDTHANNFPRLKDGLCPTLDQIYPAVLDDLEERGLLDETLVLLISEHGRTPKIASVPGGGRDHWGPAYFGVFAGAGVPRGQVVGSTDKQGGYPASRPIDPKDILATVYHLVGVDPYTTTYEDRLGRARMLLPFGDVVPELLG